MLSQLTTHNKTLIKLCYFVERADKKRASWHLVWNSWMMSRTRGRTQAANKQFQEDLLFFARPFPSNCGYKDPGRPPRRHALCLDVRRAACWNYPDIRAIPDSTTICSRRLTTFPQRIHSKLCQRCPNLSKLFNHPVDSKQRNMCDLRGQNCQGPFLWPQTAPEVFLPQFMSTHVNAQTRGISARQITVFIEVYDPKTSLLPSCFLRLMDCCKI